MQWEQSNLKPPIWWQLRLAGGMLDVSIRLGSDGYYYTSVGRGFHTREAAFSTLSEAKSWGIKEMRKVLKEMKQELSPRFYLLEACFICAIPAARLSAIALGVIWLIGGF